MDDIRRRANRSDGHLEQTKAIHIISHPSTTNIDWFLSKTRVLIITKNQDDHPLQSTLLECFNVKDLQSLQQ